MLELRNSYPNLVIPEYFQVKHLRNEWRIIHQDYLSEINSIFDNRKDAEIILSHPDGLQSKLGRGKYPIVNIKDIEVIVRTYKRGGLPAWLLPDVFINPRRVLNELILTEKARHNGVPLAEILAVQIKWVFPFLYTAKIISKKIQNTQTLEDYLIFLSRRYGSDYKNLYQIKKGLIGSIIHTMKQLHQAGIFHNDLNIRNILIQTKPQPLQDKLRPDPFVRDVPVLSTYIIDLDKAVYEEPLSWEKRVNNLIRLNRSLEKLCFRYKSLDIITHTDRLSFLMEYFKNSDINKPQQNKFINKCVRNIRVHKWWWAITHSSHPVSVCQCGRAGTRQE
jgi:hypothetical protein